MTMYRIQKDENRLQPFRSDKFSDKYLEKDLEDWFEANSIVLIDGEPCMIIGRQVNTEGGGTIDLLGLDAEGSVLVVELKRAPTPRDIVAQALEYAAWVSTLDKDGIRRIGEEYLLKQGDGISFEVAYANAFGAGKHDEEVPAAGVASVAGINLNERQRIIIVVEGRNDRTALMVRYLASYGLDISLLEYNYYKTEAGEEILDVEVRYSREEAAAHARPSGRYTEDAVLSTWPAETVKGYEIFRDRLMDEPNVSIHPQKTTLSFYRTTRDGRVFLGYFAHSSVAGGNVTFRKDSLEPYLDIRETVKQLRSSVGEDVSINEGTVNVSIHFPLPSKYPKQLADFIAEHFLPALE